MLACLDAIRQHDSNFEFVAIAPPIGKLADALIERGLRLWPSPFTADYRRKHSKEESDHALIETVRRAEPDLLHANSLSMGRVTGRISDRLTQPTTSHLRDIINISQSAMNDLNRNLRLFAVSHATRDAHSARGLESSRIHVIHNGLDLDAFQPRPRSGWLRRELSLSPESILLGTIGQIGLRKGQDTLARSAPEIASAIPNVHFLLIGERSSNKQESIEFEQNLTSQFESRGLKSRLHLLGYREDICRLMAEIDLVVHPANQEPYGRVLLEAAACGVPVIATSVGGTAEIVVDRVTGRLIPPRDPGAMANAVIDVLSNDSERNSMKLLARARALDHFGIDRCARQTADAWSEIIESR